jgi:TonB family protein
MRPPALLLPVFLLWVATCTAQAIRGVVYDGDGAIVAGARVFLMQDYVKQQETRSSERGDFVFGGLRPGTYQVQVKQERLSIFQQTVVLSGAEEARVYAVLALPRMLEAVRIETSLSPGVHHAEIPPASRRVGGKVVGPTPLQPLRPRFPPGAAGRGIQGVVVLHVRVGTDGAPGEPIVLESPDPDLEKEVLRAVASLRYAPMKLNGRAVECYVTIVCDFKLR